MTKSRYLQLVESEFRRLLKTGRSVALEEAARSVPTPDGIGARCIGVIPRSMKRAGEIERVGHRPSTTRGHNCGTKTQWRWIPLKKRRFANVKG